MLKNTLSIYEKTNVQLRSNQDKIISNFEKQFSINKN